MAEDYLDKLFNADPLRDAADVADDRELRTSLGRALAYRNVQDIAEERARVLHERGDTVRNDDLGRYLGIAEKLGFGLVYDEVFSDRDGETDCWYGVLFHPEHGAVLEIDTYRGADTVNSATLTYNWKPTMGPDGRFVKGYWEATGSGRFDSPSMDDPREAWVFTGSKTVGEGLARTLDKLTTFGTFVTPWQYDAGLDLTHHGDFLDVRPGLPTDQDRKAYSSIRVDRAAHRSAQLPDEVRSRIIVDLRDA